MVQNENNGSDNQLWKFEMFEKVPKKDSLTELKMGTTTEASVRIYHETLDYQMYQFSGSMPAINAIDLIHTKIGSWHEEAQYLTYVSRGLGMPMTYDFVPQWPNRSLSHYWNVLIDEKGKEITGSVIGTDGSCNDNGSTKEKVFDKNILTGFDAPMPNGGWFGLKLPKAVRVSKIRFVPRTDGNIIEQGDNYELVYWNNG